MMNLENSEMEIKVFTSSNKDAEKVGKEIADNISKNLKQKPNFALLFCTGHYEENDGFRKILDSVKNSLPRNTLLVGGNVAGFVTRDGCYARGATVLTVYYPNMNISIGVGKNTKRNPQKAARQCSRTIKKDLKGGYENKILLSFISCSEVPNIPFMDDSTNIKSKTLSKIMLASFSFAQKSIQKGFGREQEVLEEIIKEIPDFNIIHGSMINTCTFEDNYLFYNKEILKEVVICLAIETDLKFNLESAHGAKKIGEKFRLTDVTKNRFFIKKINDKSAFNEFLKIMNWTKESFDKEKLADIVSRYPLAFEKNGKIFLRPIGAFMGDYIGTMSKLEKDEVFVTKITESDIINSVDEIITCRNPEFGFIVSCVGRQGIIGLKIFEVQEKLKNYFKDKEFLKIYTGGEGIKKNDEELCFHNSTITSAIFSK